MQTLGGKHGVLWEMCKWIIEAKEINKGRLNEVNNPLSFFPFSIVSSFFFTQNVLVEISALSLPFLL